MKMTEGMRSSEFWVSIASGLFGIFVTLGIFSADQSADMIDAVGKFVGAVITAISAAGYAISRGMAKKKKQ